MACQYDLEDIDPAVRIQKVAFRSAAKPLTQSVKERMNDPARTVMEIRRRKEEFYTNIRFIEVVPTDMEEDDYGLYDIQPDEMDEKELF